MSRSLTDLLRVVAVSYVVFNHATWNGFVEVGESHAHAGSWFFAILNQLGKPSVLLFLFLSGFAFGAHPKWGRREAGSGWRFSLEFYRNRALRILPPYILMSLIGFAITLVSRWRENPGASAAMAPGSEAPAPADYLATVATLALNFLTGLLDGGHMFHLYFVALLFALYLLFPWLVGRKTSTTGFSFALAGLAILAVYLIVDPHNREIQSRIPLIANIAPAVQARLPGFATSWTILFAYALPFFAGGVRVGQWSVRRPAERMQHPAEAPGARGGHQAGGVRSRLFAPGALALLTACAFALVFTDFVWHVYITNQFPDSAGRIWRPVVVVYALIALLFIGKLSAEWSFAGNALPSSWAKSLSARIATRMDNKRLRGLARLGFLVYLTHPLLQFAFSGLPFAYRVPLILGLAWPLALALSALARRSRLAGFLLGEGDRPANRREDKDAGVPSVAPPVLAPVR